MKNPMSASSTVVSRIKEHFFGIMLGVLLENANDTFRQTRTGLKKLLTVQHLNRRNQPKQTGDNMHGDSNKGLRCNYKTMKQIFYKKLKKYKKKIKKNHSR